MLIPVFQHADRAAALLTRRTAHLRGHGGEISFPGGRQEPGESLVETALREAEEEIGLEAASVDIIGELDHVITLSSNHKVVPYVGALACRPVRLAPNPLEVAEIIEVDLAELMTDGVHSTEMWPMPEAAGTGGERRVHIFEISGTTIWGATARMLVNLLCASLELAFAG